MSASDLQPGTLVGEYSVDGVVGEGSFGTVYAATHPVIGKRVAIKVLALSHAQKPQQVSRFIEEARAVNRIGHKNIVDIFSFGQLPDGRHYFVMELLEGKTLGAYLKERGRMGLAEALPLLRKIARALDAAHAAGIAHRDLKPDNLFLLFDEDGITPKLLDFGIAKLMDESQKAHRTATGVQLGTPLYMSPEQCRGSAVDHKTDMYSFGVLAHEMLSGKHLFDHPTVPEIMVAHMSEEPPPLSQVATDLPRGIDVPLLELLAKDPAARPATLAAAVDKLEAAARAARGGAAQPALTPPALTPPAVTPPAATMPQRPMQPPGGGSYAYPQHSQPRASYQQPHHPVARSLDGMGGTLPSAQGNKRSSRLWWALGGGCGGMTLVVVLLIALVAAFGKSDEKQAGETTAGSADTAGGVLFAAKPPQPNQQIGMVGATELTLAFSKDGRRVRLRHRLKTRRDHDVIAVRGSRISQLRVRFERYDELNQVNDSPERREHSILPGKTYEVKQQGDELEVRRAGGGVSQQEAALVIEQVDDMFEPNGLAELLDGKRLEIGTSKRVDPELALRIFGLDDDKFTVVDPVFTLREVTKHGGAPVAHFDLTLRLSIDDDDVDMNAKLTGKLSVQVETLYPMALELSGPVAVEGRGVKPESGKITASTSMDYR